MSEIKSRADLFESAAKMMRMCDEAGIEYWYKIGGLLVHSTNGKSWGFDAFPCDPQSYEFPIAVVEGKPVFKGDKLYYPDGSTMVATSSCKFSKKDGGVWDMSWIPPKPKTVMVELPREDAEAYVRAYGDCAVVFHKSIVGRIAKALEELK